MKARIIEVAITPSVRGIARLNAQRYARKMEIASPDRVFAMATATRAMTKECMVMKWLNALGIFRMKNKAMIGSDTELLIAISLKK